MSGPNTWNWEVLNNYRQGGPPLSKELYLAPEPKKRTQAWYKWSSNRYHTERARGLSSGRELPIGTGSARSGIGKFVDRNVPVVEGLLDTALTIIPSLL